MAAAVKITDRATGDEVFALRFTPVAPGEEYPVKELNVENVSGQDLDNVRINVQLIKGGTSGGENEEGQEGVDEKWVEVRIPPSAFKAIGGPYSDTDPVANYLDVGSVVTGGDFDLDVKAVLPASIDTVEIWYVRLGVSLERV